jgi:hypothetical protein
VYLCVSDAYLLAFSIYFDEKKLGFCKIVLRWTEKMKEIIGRKTFEKK